MLTFDVTVDHHEFGVQKVKCVKHLVGVVDDIIGNQRSVVFEQIVERCCNVGVSIVWVCPLCGCVHCVGVSIVWVCPLCDVSIVWVCPLCECVHCVVWMCECVHCVSVSIVWCVCVGVSIV